MSTKTFLKKHARSTRDTELLEERSSKRGTIFVLDNVNINTMGRTCQRLFMLSANVRKIKTVVTFSK